MASFSSGLLRYRLAALVSMLVLAPLGYWVRFSQGLFPDWVSDAFGSICYEIFWILLAVFFFPKISVRRTAIAVCLVTCVIEFSQLWHPAFLQAARATWVGRLVLGNTFSWGDFPSYFIGSVLGWLGVGWLQRIVLRSQP